MPSGGVVQGPQFFSHQGDKRHRCAGVLWVEVHLRHTVGPKSTAAPKWLPRIGHSCYKTTIVAF